MQTHRRRVPRRIAALAALLVAAALPAARATAQPATFLVGGDNCDFATIQPAIDAAAAHPGPDVIHVATNAMYTAQALRMNAQDVEIVGGFATCASAAPTPGAKTTISGAGGVADSVLVILGSGDRSLRNLIITGGDESDDDFGGGIDFQGTGELALSSVIVSQNRAGFGGGISFEGLPGGAELALETDVVVQNNVAAGSGGGIRLFGNAQMFMFGANTTLTGNEALGNFADTGYGGGIQIIPPATAQIASPGFGAIGAVAFNRARFGGGIALTTRSEGMSIASALLFTIDPRRPVRVQGNIASVAGGGVYLDRHAGPSGTSEVTDFCAHEFRIDGNRAPDGAAVFVDTDEEGVDGAIAFFNSVDGCSVFSLPPSPLARPCDSDVACNLVDGNVVQQASGGAAMGSVFALQEGATLVARRVAFERNVGNDLILARIADDGFPHVNVSECLLADNTLTARVIASDTARISNCTIAGNVIALSTFSITASVDLRNTIVWQPGFATLAPLPAELVGNMLLSNDGLGLPGATSAAPRFIDPARGDYHLRAGSPAVDYAPPIPGDDRDLENLPHDQDLPVVADLFGTRDLGAYERPALLPLELNGTFDADLNLWTEATAGITRFDPAENAAGLNTGGALEVDYVNAPVVLSRVAGRTQCIHLPGPGTYRLNGFARTSGSLPPSNVQSARLQWEFRRAGTEACTTGPADRSGDHVITSGSSFVQPAFGTVIEVAPGELTPTSSIAITTVVQSTGLAPSPRLHAWFDGIRLIVDTLPPPFLFGDGFE